MEKSELTAQEKRANAARLNALNDLAAYQNQTMAEMTAAGLHEPTGLWLSNNPVAMGQLVQQILVQLKQQEIALNALAELILEGPMVMMVPDPDLTPEQQATSPPRLAPHPLSRVAYWERIAKSAEETLSTLRRGVLSAGAAVRQIIARPN